MAASWPATTAVITKTNSVSHSRGLVSECGYAGSANNASYATNTATEVASAGPRPYSAAVSRTGMVYTAEEFARLVKFISGPSRPVVSATATAPNTQQD